MKLVGGGSVINGATPSSFWITQDRSCLNWIASGDQFTCLVWRDILSTILEEDYEQAVIFYRPGVAGAVLQTALLLIDSFSPSAFSSNSS